MKANVWVIYVFLGHHHHQLPISFDEGCLCLSWEVSFHHPSKYFSFLFLSTGIPKRGKWLRFIRSPIPLSYRRGANGCVSCVFTHPPLLPERGKWLRFMCVHPSPSPTGEGKWLRFMHVHPSPSPTGEGQMVALHVCSPIPPSPTGEGEMVAFHVCSPIPLSYWRGANGCVSCVFTHPPLLPERGKWVRFMRVHPSPSPTGEGEMVAFHACSPIPLSYRRGGNGCVACVFTHTPLSYRRGGNGCVSCVFTHTPLLLERGKWLRFMCVHPSPSPTGEGEMVAFHACSPIPLSYRRGGNGCVSCVFIHTPLLLERGKWLRFMRVHPSPSPTGEGQMVLFHACSPIPLSYQRGANGCVSCMFTHPPLLPKRGKWLRFMRVHPPPLLPERGKWLRFISVHPSPSLTGEGQMVAFHACSPIPLSYRRGANGCISCMFTHPPLLPKRGKWLRFMHVHPSPSPTEEGQMVAFHACSPIPSPTEEGQMVAFHACSPIPLSSYPPSHRLGEKSKSNYL